MNKLLTKIVGLSLGLSMAIGVGVAASYSGKDAVKADASSDYTATLAQSSSTANYTDTKGNKWTLDYTSDGSVSVDSSTWLKTGTNSVKATSISLETDAYKDYVIDKVTIHVKAKANTSALGYIYIGGTEATKSSSVLANADTELSFDNSTDKLSGSIKVAVDRGSSKTGALYLGTVVVEYSEASTETYTVSFDKNGGDGSMSPVTDVHGSYTLPANGFTAPANKAFIGWKANNTGDLIPAGGSYTVSSNVTFYAQWANAYSVTYTAGTHGSGSFVHTSQPEGNYTLLPFADLSGVSASTGYRFASYTVGGVTKNPGETITLSATTSVTVNFEEKGLETTYDFTKNFETYATNWTNSYGDHTGLAGVEDIGGDYAATIDFYKTSKQTSNITNQPVFATKTGSGSWYKVAVFTLNESGYKIKSVSASFTQWGSKTPDVALFKGNGVDTTALDTATIGTKNTLSTSDLNDTVFSIGYCDKNTGSNVQSGLASITITLEASSPFGTLDHIKVTSLPNTIYHVGETFSFDGFAVTAYDNADESIANFKDVTSLVETDLDNPGAFVDSDVPGLDCDVQYTGDGGSDTTSFHVYVYALAQYELVTTEPADWSGNYLIVGATKTSTLAAMDGSLYNPDVEKGYKEVVATDSIIEAGQELEWAIAAIEGGYSIQGTSGKYIGSLTSKSNGMLVSDSAVVNTLSITESNVTITGTNTYQLQLNTTGDRFRYYSSGTVQLYKKVESSAGDLYAQTFLGAFTCDNGAHEPSFTIKEGSTYWSWALLKEEYNKLSNEDKEDFRIGTPSEEGSNIQQAIARYDAVIRHWGEAKYENFMNRTITPVGGLKVAFGLFEDPNTSITIIVAISAISLTSVGAFFALRKRKENI